MAAVASRINLLSSQEWTSIGTLTYELSNLTVKKQPSNEEQVVIDWMKSRLDYLNSRRG
jgi:hypothetical protein